MKTAKPRPPKKPTDAAIAKAVGVSIETVRRYRRAGVNTRDLDAIARHAGGNKVTPDALAAPDLREAKLRKVLLECSRIEFQLDAEKRKFIPVDEVTADMVRIATTMRGELSRFVGDSGNFAGLAPAEIHARCKKWADDFCAVLANPKSYADAK